MNELNWKAFVVPIVILIVFIGGIIGIVNWQKSQKTSATNPTLVVNIPEEGLQTTEKDATIEGSTDKGNKLYINNENIKLEKDARFLKTYPLNEGANQFEIKAENKAKKTTVAQRTITYKSAVAPTTTVPATTTAPQTQGSAVGVQASGDLATSGPKEVAAVIGFGGLVLVGLFYLKSKKQLSLNMRK